MNKRVFKIAYKTILWILGIWLGLLLLLEIVLSPSVASKIVHSIADEYIEGDLNFTKVRVSMFKRFPSLYVEIDDFSLTYPADRYDEIEKAGAQGWLSAQGRGEVCDTLASFKSFKASVRLIALLTGDIRIPYLNLDKPRIFAHSYNDGQANWNIIKMDSEEEETPEVEEDDDSFLSISLGKISLTDHPHIVFTDSRDTLFALLRMKKMEFEGKIANRHIEENKIGLQIDSLIAAGRIGRDTLAFNMQNLSIREKEDLLDVHMEAKTLLATQALGRLNVPILLDGSVGFPEDSVSVVHLENFNADIATVPIQIDGDIRFHEDGVYVGADAQINQCNLNGLLKGLAKNIVPESENISTDALLTFKAHCDGKYIYNTGQLPQMTLSAEVPRSRISHTALKENISLALNMKAGIDENGLVNATLNKVDISTYGLGLDISGGGTDLLGEDPRFKIKGTLAAKLNDLMTFVPDSLGITASGNIQAEIDGEVLMSQMDLYRFSEAKLTGEILGNNINIDIPSDQLSANINTLDIKLGPEDKKSRRDTTEAMRMLAFRGSVDSLSFIYGNLKAYGRGLNITAMSSAEVLKGEKKFHHVSGRFAAKSLYADDGTGSRIMLRETSNGFRVTPDKENAKVPILTFTSRNKSITVKSGVQRAGLKDATIVASATLNKIKRQPPRNRMRKGPSQKWMQDADFRKQDIDIRLDEEMAKYFKEWDFRGSMKINGGFIASPYFPLRNRLNGFDGRFNSNEIIIDKFSISSGKSNISADGRLSGLRNMLVGGRGGALNLRLNVYSEAIDADELIRAYNTGLQFSENRDNALLENVSDDEYQETIAIDSTSTADVQMATLVVPGNINATLNLDTRNIKYSGLQIDSLKATAIIKERCIQITETEAKSNVGDIYFNGFYASRSKKDIKAGFSVDFKDITAEKVISLMPAIDTLMPVLKSFHGLLNCEIAATSQLDTSMNLIMPSINGILRITGDDLAIKNDAMFRKLARKLLFKNKKEGIIDHMSVEGVIADNVVEIFPFVLQMDRYTLALSGIQNLDMSFKYHVSLIKSPFLIRLGVDLSGPDFDNMKFRIGRAKYKNPNVPVFSKVIDETKVNLVSSIKNIFKKGVDEAIRENNSSELIRKRKKDIKYVRAVDQELEELSDDEKKKVEEEEARQDAETTTEKETITE